MKKGASGALLFFRSGSILFVRDGYPRRRFGRHELGDIAGRGLGGDRRLVRRGLHGGLVGYSFQLRDGRGRRDRRGGGDGGRRLGRNDGRGRLARGLGILGDRGGGLGRRLGRKDRAGGRLRIRKGVGGVRGWRSRFRRRFYRYQFLQLPGGQFARGAGKRGGLRGGGRGKQEGRYNYFHWLIYPRELQLKYKIKRYNPIGPNGPFSGGSLGPGRLFAGATGYRNMKILAFLFLLFSAIPAAAEPPLRALFWYLPPTLDTRDAEKFALLPLAKNIYAPLVSSFLDGKPRGMAAESWTVSPDGLTWRFRIRKGLSFQDGSPLTAEAAAANFKRILWLTRSERMALNALLPEIKNWGSYAEPLKSLYAENGEVVFKFSRRPKNLLEAISQPIYGLADPKCFGADGAWKEPFCAGGSGEYLIAERAANRLLLKARRIFERAENAPAAVEFLVPTPASPSYLKTMVEGGADLALTSSLELDGEMRELMRPARVEALPLPKLRMNFAMLNPSRPPFSDPALRRSFRDVFLARLRAAGAEPDASFFPRGTAGYLRFPEPKAPRPLLTHAGETAVVFLNKKSANPLKKKHIFSDIVRQAVLDSLEAHGLKAEILNPSEAQHWARYGKGDYDFLVQASVLSVENTFESLRTLFMRKDGAGLPDPQGKIARLIEEAEGREEPAARRGIAEKINRAIFEEAAEVTYANSGMAYLYGPGVNLSRCSTFPSPIEFRAVGWTPAAR